MIWINGFPLPPSVNEYLMPVAGKVKINQKTGKPYRAGHFVKTPIHKQFMDDCYLWRLKNNAAFWQIHAAIHKHKQLVESRGEHFALRVDAFFVFHVERVFSTKNSLIERIDADNRLKPCRDALSNLLEIDDKHFFAGGCEKVTTQAKELECSILRISPMRPRTLEEIKALQKMEANTPAS